jgi:hypothetical protein
MAEGSLAFVCVVAIVGTVAIVGIITKQWVRVKARRNGVDVESRPTE